ncbi:hypothetical protein [Henriciella sp.]|uniref:hypothetical protein n=1 Tax=Henriciella sp. TaxID=1968823 RepID=UPI00260F82A6|nr:hypothetical protein [Henriciella sp.]
MRKQAKMATTPFGEGPLSRAPGDAPGGALWRDTVTGLLHMFHAGAWHALPEDQMEGAAVTDEMLSAGRTEAISIDPRDGLTSEDLIRIYRAMRTLEPLDNVD